MNHTLCLPLLSLQYPIFSSAPFPLTVSHPYCFYFVFRPKNAIPPRPLGSYYTPCGPLHLLPGPEQSSHPAPCPAPCPTPYSHLLFLSPIPPTPSEGLLFPLPLWSLATGIPPPSQECCYTPSMRSSTSWYSSCSSSKLSSEVSQYPRPFASKKVVTMSRKAFGLVSSRR
jgi:hypothetical protein